MKFYIISDTHFNHSKIATYCDRPSNHTELTIRNCQNTVRPEDTVICVGDVFIGPPSGWAEIRKQLPGTWWLIRGNHDHHHGAAWWCDHGFVFAADAMIFRRVWFTHRPSSVLPEGCDINIHGHLHNIWNGFHPDDPAKSEKDHLISSTGHLEFPYQRLFALEYTNYMPVELEKFIAHPDRYNARGPNGKNRIVQ